MEEKLNNLQNGYDMVVKKEVFAVPCTYLFDEKVYVPVLLYRRSKFTDELWFELML